jgi:hypothetical protein
MGHATAGLCYLDIDFSLLHCHTALFVSETYRFLSYLSLASRSNASRECKPDSKLDGSMAEYGHIKGIRYVFIICGKSHGVQVVDRADV